MSTRSQIAIQLESGTIRTVYCHFDGYLEGVGATLLHHYNTFQDAYDLIELGNISQLHETIENPTSHSFATPAEACTVFYGRDRAEKDQGPKDFEKFSEFMTYCQNAWAEFVYLYSMGEWTVYQLNGQRLTPEMVREEAQF